MQAKDEPKPSLESLVEAAEILCRKLEALEAWDSLTLAAKLKEGLQAHLGEENERLM